MSDPPASTDYVQRVNRAIDYLSQHLDEAPSLEQLAAEACFSPYHFHRIFKAMTGETVHAHTRRVRVSRAAQKLRAAPRSRATDVALDYGFASLSDFSRAFKQAFGITFRQWHRDDPLHDSKIPQVASSLPRYTADELDVIGGEFVVQVREFPETRIAYIRVMDAYAEGRVPAAYQRLRAWADRTLGAGPHAAIGMSEDDPDITPPSRCRYDIAVAVPSHADGGGEISFRTLRGGPLAALHVEGDLPRVDRAWQYLFRSWLPRSRYQPADAPAMEMFLKMPEEWGWNRFDLECCVPLAPL